MNTITPLALTLAAVLAAGGCGKKDDAPSGETPATNTPAPPTEKPAEPAAEKPAEPAAKPEIVTEEVTYNSGKQILKGFLAYPKDAKNVPGVLVVHEWWGANDYPRMRAKKLAEMGYAAFALDMYGDGKVADHPDGAQKFMKESLSNIGEAEARFRAAEKLLRDNPVTDPTKVSAIGYCYGGAVVLHMARLGEDLDVVGSFHGVLSTEKPAAKGAIKAKLLVATGAADPFVPPDQVEAFKKEMAAAGADLDFKSYEGAKHAFTNPAATENGTKFKLPLAYDQKADEDSWAELGKLLKEAYGQ